MLLSRYSRVTGSMALVMCATSALAQDARLEQISDYFSDAVVLDGPKLVDCTLSGGTETTCFQISVSPTPQTYTPGPWCPTGISDGADKGGIWFLNGLTVDVDGEFIQSLSEVYGDKNWQLFDPETGDVRYTGTLESCEAAARPDVDEAYNNYCVQCLPEYLPEDTAITYVIPLEPSDMDRAGETRGGSGLAYNGVRLDGPAPTDAILGAYTIAALDDCGGHVNTHVGYHYHAVTDCLDGSARSSGPASLEQIASSGHDAQIGIAMDGYQIFSRLMADGSLPTDLDECNGHETEGMGYHYHAGLSGSNAILGCLKAEIGCTLDDEGGTCDASKRPSRP